ncbi:MAG: O-antigen polymerase [Coriobacteriales bacterium]|nr:O-antigen polymerase [Coriobacteriales bacterium]
MSSVLLLVLLIALLVASYLLFGRRLDSPAFVFVLFFALAVGNGLANYEPFAFDLHPNTVALVGGGAALFVAVAFCVQAVWNKLMGGREASEAEDDLLVREPLHVPVALYVLGFALALGTTWLLAMSFTRISVEHGGPSDLLGVMKTYDRLAKFSDVDVSIRGPVGMLVVICDATYYLWAYVVAQNLNAKRRIVNVPAMLIMVIIMFYTLFSGERNGLIMRFLAFAFLYLNFLYRRYRTNKKNPTARICAVIAIAVAVGLLAFRPMLSLVGRSFDERRSLSDYVSTYLGAPIKNLDMYLNDELPAPITSTPTRWGDQTLAMAYASLDHWAGHDAQKKWDEWQPFQTINGRKLGNVYTIYYTFVFDWGYVGGFVATAVLAALCELCFLFSNTQRILWNGSVKTSMLIYSILGYGLCFCFFLNFVVKVVVNSGFPRMVAVWLVSSSGLAFLNGRTEKRAS